VLAFFDQIGEQAEIDAAKLKQTFSQVTAGSDGLQTMLADWAASYAVTMPSSSGGGGGSNDGGSNKNGSGQQQITSSPGTGWGGGGMAPAPQPVGAWGRP